MTAARLRAALAAVAVAAAAALGGAIALATFGLDRTLSVGTIHASVDPGHRGALDIYVPLVDWGTRFDGVRLPARLRVDVRSIDRESALRLAGASQLNVERLRAEATDALASYIRLLVLVVLGAALGLSLLVALALRGHSRRRLAWLAGTGGASAVAVAAAVALLLPPRGDLGAPEYYAHGPDIPRALTAIRSASASATVLSDELNAQLVGIARFVSAPAARTGHGRLPRLTIASDLHNNVVSLPALQQAARGGPLLFPGDLTDRGSPVEARLVRRIAAAGRPLVFVTGNHDSDTLARRLAREGAVVLTARGRLGRDGRLGPRIAEVGGLRIAGYGDPFERRGRDGYADLGATPDADQQAAFAAWLRPLADEVDVVMVHSPALAARGIAELRADPPRREITFVVGHTHEPSVRRWERVTVVNGGTVGGGGTGNLAEGQPIGLAVLTYRARPRYRPIAADVVEIDPGSGSASARRTRLDVPAGESMSSGG